MQVTLYRPLQDPLFMAVMELNVSGLKTVPSLRSLWIDKFMLQGIWKGLYYTSV